MTNQPRVLLTSLSVRTSAKGSEYLAGYLGKCRLVGFKGKQADKFGNEVWELFLTQLEERPRHEPEVAGLVNDPADAF